MWPCVTPWPLLCTIMTPVGYRKKHVLVLACQLTMLRHFVVYVHPKIYLIIDDLWKKSWRPTGVFAGMQKSGGVDGDVVLLLLLRRHFGGAGWRGNLVERHLLYILAAPSCSIRALRK